MRSVTFLFVCMLMLLTGCGGGGPIRLHIPQNRFELPETAAKEQFELAAGYKFNEYTITFTEDLDTIPVETYNPEVIVNHPDDNKGSDDRWRFTVHYGFMRNTEIFLWGDISTAVGLKYQFAGKPLGDSAAGDFSAAISLAYGDEDHTNNDAFSTEQDFWDYSVLAGYRVTDNVLAYISGFKTESHYNIYVKSLPINQDRGEFSENINIEGSTFGIFFEMSDKIGITLEALDSHLRTGNVERGEQFYGISFMLKSR